MHSAEQVFLELVVIIYSDNLNEKISAKSILQNHKTLLLSETALNFSKAELVVRKPHLFILIKETKLLMLLCLIAQD